jgi:solute carrier family 13 (sodium-dependent dicarboxylate transporter), member 2/3/5
VFAPFADPIMFLFLGSFILARAMSLHALDKRIALAFLSLPGVGSSPARVLAAMGLVTALLSMWVTNTATTAMMLPIAVGVLSALHNVQAGHGPAAGPLDARAWPFATGMMLMVAYAASIGGIGTPVGSAPNLISIAYVDRLAGVRISFFRWMSVMVPMLAVMWPALFVLLYLLHPARRRPVGPAGDRPAGAPKQDSPAAGGDMSAYLRREKLLLGPWTRGQLNTAVAFAVAVFLWVTPGMLAVIWGEADPSLKWLLSRFPEPAVALLAALLLFVLPTDLRRGRMTLTWSEAVQIDWGTILLFGGGLSLGGLMLSTGLANGLGNVVTGLTGTSSVWVLTAAAIGMGIFLSETTSNTTSANIVVPVMIAAAQSAGVHPVPPALGAVLGSSFGFMLPVSTPPNAIVYGSGLVPMPRMIRAGALFDVAGFFIIWVGLRLLCPLLGLA